MLMAGCPQCVVLLSTSWVAIDAGRSPMVKGFSLPRIVSVAHLGAFSLAALLCYRCRAGVTAQRVTVTIPNWPSGFGEEGSRNGWPDPRNRKHERGVGRCFVFIGSGFGQFSEDFFNAARYVSEAVGLRA